jgi:hypothetical protein
MVFLHVSTSRLANWILISNLSRFHWLCTPTLLAMRSAQFLPLNLLRFPLAGCFSVLAKSYRTGEVRTLDLLVTLGNLEKCLSRPLAWLDPSHDLELTYTKLIHQFLWSCFELSQVLLLVRVPVIGNLCAIPPPQPTDPPTHHPISLFKHLSPVLTLNINKTKSPQLQKLNTQFFEPPILDQSIVWPIRHTST